MSEDSVEDTKLFSVLGISLFIVVALDVTYPVSDFTLFGRVVAMVGSSVVVVSMVVLKVVTVLTTVVVASVTILASVKTSVVCRSMPLLLPKLFDSSVVM